MSKFNMTQDEMLKDLLLDFTQGLRNSLIEILDRIIKLENDIDRRFKNAKIPLDTRRKKVG